ncbi:MAG: site-2 protease family protein [Candidatus Bipolaricaulota bacterium]
MLGKRITLFRLLGFKVQVDASWLIIAVLVTWSLTVGVFPAYFEGLSATTYVIMGVAGAVGLFASIVFHELSHSLIARRFGLEMRGITLFVFGGVAEMDDEPPSAVAELAMALAGPAASVVAGGVLYGLHLIGDGAGWPVQVTGVLFYVGLMNLVLAAFNLIPAFPLDGGRVLRSLLWQWRGNLRWATRVASIGGSAFGVLLIALGLLNVIRGEFVPGLWLAVIGLFVRSASQASYRQVVTRDVLQGETVRRFMVSQPVTVPRAISVRELVENYVYRYHYKFFPVLDEDRLVGCVTTRAIKELPGEEWDRHTVGELAQSCSPENTVSPDSDVMDALSLMRRSGNSRLMVVENGQLLGIVSLKDLLEFLNLKLDLEGG